MPARKLPLNAVLRRHVADGMSFRAVARQYGVYPSAVFRSLNRDPYFVTSRATKHLACDVSKQREAL